MDRFAKESSLQGIPAIFDRSEDKLTRFLVGFACLIAFGGLGFYIHGIYVKVVITPETAEEINLIPSMDVPFPAVTICSPLFSKNNSPNIQKVLNNRDLILSDSEQDSLAANIQACRPSFAKTILHMCKHRNSSNILKILSEKSSILFQHDLLFGVCISLKTNYLQPCENILKITLTEHGFCYTYNSEPHILNQDVLKNQNVYLNKKLLANEIKDKLETLQWTIEQGYLNDNITTHPVRATDGTYFIVYPAYLNNDLNNFCEFGKNFKVFLHMPHEIVTPFHKPEFFKVGQSKELFIKIKMYKKSLDFKKFKSKSRGCFFENERKLKFFNFYTENLCMLECLTNYTYKFCGCVKFSMPHDESIPICDLNQTLCYLNAAKNISQSELSKCNCLKPCIFFEYNIVSRISAKKFNDLKFYNQSWENISTSFTRIKLTHNQMAVEEISSLLVYHTLDGISDLGSLLGIFFGCSIVSIIEIIYFSLFPHVDLSNNENENSIESTFHGVQHVMDTNSHPIIRTIWALILLSSVAYCMYSIDKNYIMLAVIPEISKSSKHVESSNFPFPSLTMCSPIFTKSDQVSYLTTIKEFNKNYNYLNEINATKKNFFLANLHWCAPNIITPAMNMSKISDIDANFTKVLSESRPSLHEFLHECRVSNQKIPCSKLFSRILTPKSFCYSFNLLNIEDIFTDQMTKEFAYENIFNGSISAWSLDHQYNSADSKLPLKASNEFYLTFKHRTIDLKYICPTLGLKIVWYVHLPSEIPTKEYWAYNFKTKSKVNINLKSFRTSNSLRKFTPTNRGCLFEDEKKLRFFKKYTQNMCIFECKANKTLEECGCVQFSMPRNDSTKICSSMIEANCSYFMMEDPSAKENSLTPCGCLPNCNRLEYEIKNKKIKDKLDVKIANYTTGYMKFKIETSFTKEEETHLAYEFKDFINDFGGLLGLFIGCSMVSLGEIIFTLPIAIYNKVISYFRNKKRRNEEKEDEEFWIRSDLANFLEKEFGHKRYLQNRQINY